MILRRITEHAKAQNYAKTNPDLDSRCAAPRFKAMLAAADAWFPGAN